jgi:hypothetical protein
VSRFAADFKSCELIMSFGAKNHLSGFVCDDQRAIDAG